MDNDTLSDFYLEADELFKQAEDALLEIEKSDDYEKHFSSVFRAFHSLKGAAGMLDLFRLQEHMHFLEGLLEKKKHNTSMSEKLVDYLLEGLDASKVILTDGDVKFSYYDPDFEDDESTADLILDGAKKNVNNATNIPINETAKKSTKSLKAFKSTENKVGHVFVVDDEVDILTISKILLEEHNFVVSTFQDAHDAITALEFISPDVIVTDISMPKMNGVEFMRKVNKLKPHLPIIVFSGHVTKDVCMDALAAGVSGILEKPIDQHKFISQVQTAYDRYQAFKLMMNGLDLLVYQFEDFDKYLQDLGHKSKREVIRTELKKLLKQKQILIQRAS